MEVADPRTPGAQLLRARAAGGEELEVKSSAGPHADMVGGGAQAVVSPRLGLECIRVHDLHRRCGAAELGQLRMHGGCHVAVGQDADRCLPGLEVGRDLFLLLVAELEALVVQGPAQGAADDPDAEGCGAEDQ